MHSIQQKKKMSKMFTTIFQSQQKLSPKKEKSNFKSQKLSKSCTKVIENKKEINRTRENKSVKRRPSKQRIKKSSNSAYNLKNTFAQSFGRKSSNKSNNLSRNQSRNQSSNIKKSKVLKNSDIKNNPNKQKFKPDIKKLFDFDQKVKVNINTNSTFFQKIQKRTIEKTEKLDLQTQLLEVRIENAENEISEIKYREASSRFLDDDTNNILKQLDKTKLPNPQKKLPFAKKTSKNRNIVGKIKQSKLRTVDFFKKINPKNREKKVERYLESESVLCKF